MIPVPRMVQYGNIAPQNILLDIDFTRQNIGDTFITDAIGHTFSKTGTGSAVVENDATLGHVMTFAGASYFSTPMVNDLKLSTIAFDLRIQFKSTTTGENIPFCTGDYPSAGTIVAGMLLTVFNNTGSQLFCTDSIGNFTRCIFPYAVNTWRDISFIWTPGTKQMKIVDNDTSTVLGTYTVSSGIGDGTSLSIGASYVRGLTATFVGSIKKILIKKL